MSSKREVWIDYVKVFACILIVLGHFFQSMVKANILPPENHLYTWFNTTIYYFHVPLFFICSGYLYQKYSVVGNWKSWKDNVIKKAVVLGIPYFIFSFATWLLKTVFVGSVNNEIGGLADTLFLHPTSPYWYLYVLFFIFLVTPTACSARGVRILLAISAILKLFSIMGGTALLQIFAISRICQNEIWFVLGMMIAMHGVEKLRKPVIGFALGIIFMVLSVLFYRTENEWVSFGLGIMACASVLMIAINTKKLKLLDVLAKYTMPIFLMHTIFAAPTRTLLMKCGVQNIVAHVTVGILISIIGPILAMRVLELLKLDWFVYPRRLLKDWDG